MTSEQAKQLRALADQVEAATGANRSLDQAIYESVMIALGHLVSRDGYGFWVQRKGDDTFFTVAPSMVAEYTRSTDAAFTLVPDNHLAMVRHLWDGDHRAGHAVVHSYAQSGEEPDGKLWTADFTAVAHDLAPALTAACLRARASLIDADTGGSQP